MSSNVMGARRPPSGRVKEAVGRAVRSRHVLTYSSLLTVACVLAVLTAGAGAASKCHPFASASFADPIGDGSGANAPDITGITVTSYEGGGTSFQIGLNNASAFTSDMVIRTFIDSDKTSTTGNPKGFEYMIQAQGTATPGGDDSDNGDDQGTPPTDGSGSPPASGGGSEWAVHPRALKAIKCDGGDDGDAGIALYKWNGSGWAPVEADSLNGWFGDGNLNIQLNAHDLGNALAFNFVVYAAANVTFDDAGWPVLTNVSYDWAPDTSTYNYQPFDYSAYNDPVGDGTGKGAPDITRVTVMRWRHDHLNFSVEIPGTQEFTQDMLMRVYVDSDSNPATGDAHGFDYVIQAQPTSYAVGGSRFVTRGLEKATCYQPLLFLFAWQNGAWVPQQDASFADWRYEKGLRFSIDQSDLGGAKNFNFAVYAASHVSYGPDGHPNVASAAYDWAPDTATFGFPLAPEDGQFLGTYKVSERIVGSHNFDGMRRGSHGPRTWKFQRDCKGKQCATKVMASGSAFKLSRTGKAFKAKAGTKFDCQAGLSARGTESYQLKVQKSRWIQGKWRVTNWVGTEHVVSPNNGVPECGGTASYTATLTGTLK